jgi:arylformamidase
MDFATEADRAYANAAFIPEADAFPPRWQAAAAAFRSSLGPRALSGLEYGPKPRQRFDLFLPLGTPQGLMVFVHGGYWMAFGRDEWSHLAAGALSRGWACAMPSYTLTPEARISDVTSEIRAAVRAAHARVPGPVVVTGHSAGGHLAARMACVDGPEGVVRVVPISPLAELTPLMATELNATLRIDANEAATQSPARLLPRKGVAVHVWVGGNERPAFLWQARTLSENWNCRWTVAPDRHHFNVIDDLTDADSPLMRACLG